MERFAIETIERLEKAGFKIFQCNTSDEAKSIAIDLVKDCSSIGIGGSSTVKAMGLSDALRECGKNVYWHWECDPTEKDQIFVKAQYADAYICSCNAISKDGSIVNIDGSGNRVSSLAFGSKNVVMIVGKQKFVDGGITAALSRIKSCACPLNAKRLGLRTPCAITGKCNEESCEDGRMCNTFSIIRHPAKGRSFSIIVIDEVIGY